MKCGYIGGLRLLWGSALGLGFGGAGGQTSWWLASGMLEIGTVEGLLGSEHAHGRRGSQELLLKHHESCRTDVGRGTGPECQGPLGGARPTERVA